MKTWHLQFEMTHDQLKMCISLSKLLINHFNHISDGLVLIGLYEPLAEVALNGHVQLFLLIRSQPSFLNFLLDFYEWLLP